MAKTFVLSITSFLSSKGIMSKAILSVLIFLLWSSVSLSSDYFNWATRTNRDGKTAGYMVTTPFPVDETISTYSITNDEGTTTFNLGSIYFADNDTSGCSNGSKTYNPATRSCGSGSYTVYSSIANATSAVSSGNKTILVREGTYNEYGLTLKTGTDNTHRYMICGYGQERPIVDGIDTSTSSYVFTMANYSTLQRLKIQNHYYSGIRPADRTRPSLIDIWCYNTGSNIDNTGDAQVYAANSSYMWMYHCTIDQGYGHAIKVSDGANNSLIEWTVASGWGYWSGSNTNYSGHPSRHPYGFDYPDAGPNHILRYSVGHTGIWGAVQVRTSVNGGTISIHHNEFYEASCDNQVTGNPNGTRHHTIYLNTIHGGSLFIYSNVIRNTTIGDSDAYGIYLSNSFGAANNYIYNNIIYDQRITPVWIGSSVGTTYFYSNSLYGNSTGTLIENGNGASTYVRNNIFYQAGYGSCVGIGSAVKNNNLYYYPFGSRGYTGALETGGLEPASQNFWVDVPSGTYLSTECALASTSPAKDSGANLGVVYNVDASLVSRPQGSAWDIGAYEYKEGGSVQDISPPTGLRIIQ